jgi:hypothetical protein
MCRRTASSGAGGQGEGRQRREGSKQDRGARSGFRSLDSGAGLSLLLHQLPSSAGTALQPLAQHGAATLLCNVQPHKCVALLRLGVAPLHRLVHSQRVPRRNRSRRLKGLVQRRCSHR